MYQSINNNQVVRVSRYRGNWHYLSVLRFDRSYAVCKLVTSARSEIHHYAVSSRTF